MEHGIDLELKCGCQRFSKAVEEKWLAMYAKLQKFREEHGDCNVPRRYKDDPSLGNWVVQQRKKYHYVAVGCPALTNDRIELFESIGFVWEIRKRAPGGS